MPAASAARLPARVAWLPSCCVLCLVCTTAPTWPATRTPTGGGDVVTVGPTSPTPPPRTLWRRIFTCVSAEVVEFSDRPCGPRAAEREVKLLNPGRGEPGAAPGVMPTPTGASPRRSAARDQRDVSDVTAQAEADSQARQCERLAEAVDALDDRMRAGYSAREAARLWARWREAKARLREADC